MIFAKDRPRSDRDPILDNAAGPTEFRVSYPYARLSVDGPGTLKSWDGNSFSDGETFLTSGVIIATGLYEITLDGAGYASLNEFQP